MTQLEYTFTFILQHPATRAAALRFFDKTPKCRFCCIADGRVSSSHTSSVSGSQSCAASALPVLLDTWSCQLTRCHPQTAGPINHDTCALSFSHTRIPGSVHRASKYTTPTTFVAGTYCTTINNGDTYVPRTTTTARLARFNTVCEGRNTVHVSVLDVHPNTL